MSSLIMDYIDIIHNYCQQIKQKEDKGKFANIQC